MNPYLVHKTWIDLDHVVAIDSEVQHYSSIACGDGWLCSFSGSCEIMYREKSFQFSLGEGGKNIPLAQQELIAERAQKILNDFIDAWRDAVVPTRCQGSPMP